MFDFLFGWRKASKCKKLLRHVQCRLLLLKNKRCSIVRQLRQDVGELLKLGHAQIAFTRAEQIYKDERIIEVYDLLDRFCEFLVINMAYIRRHKDCPNDINEAISSLIFASARCGDMPELRRVRKLFGERYGPSFVMSALELLPSNLVNSQIRNNLSIKTVAEDVKIKLVNEISRDYNFLQGSSDQPLALEYNSEWHQKQVVRQEDRVDGTMDVKANHNSSAKDDEVLCITLPVSSPADQHASPIKALVPVTQGPGKQDNSPQTVTTDESKILVLAHTSDELVRCLEENAVYLEYIQEFQSPKSKDITLLDQRVFVFKSLVLPNKQQIEEDLRVVQSFKKTGKVCNRRSRKRSLSREYWSFKDLSYESYYGNKSSGICSSDTCKSNLRRKQLKNNSDYSCSRGSPCRCGSIRMIPSGEPRQIRSQSPNEVISENGIEESKESEFYYSCTDCASWRSASMPSERQDMEQHGRFVRHSSFPFQEMKHGNNIHSKLPDYRELESTFLALKNVYLLNKNP